MFTTTPDSTYLITIAKEFSDKATKPIVTDDILDLIDVGCKQNEFFENELTAEGVVTFSLRGSEELAYEVSRTPGVAKVEKTMTPNVMPARLP